MTAAMLNTSVFRRGLWRLTRFLAMIAPLIATAALASEVITARTEHVADGDSMTVRTMDGRRLKIRIAGIDAPEKGQPHGDSARAHLRELLGQHPLNIESIKTDPFGRQVARVWLNNEDVGLHMVSRGHAWHFSRYEADQTVQERNSYRNAERHARKHHLGLWRDEAPIPPWEYRGSQQRR